MKIIIIRYQVEIQPTNNQNLNKNKKILKDLELITELTKIQNKH